MARYDHFRKWLVDQYSVSPPPARRSVRAPYPLPSRSLPAPHHRLPDLPSPSPHPPNPNLSDRPLPAYPWSHHPVPNPPQSESPQAAPHRSASPALPFPSHPESLRPSPPPNPMGFELQGIAPAHNAAPLPEAVRPDPPPLSPPPSAVRAIAPKAQSQPRPSPAQQWCSFGLVLLVWLGLLGLGGYALSRILDPLFAKVQPLNELPTFSTNSGSKGPLPSLDPQEPIPTDPSVPGAFDYADATPRSMTSPIWALVAIIIASALGSRIMLQQSPHASPTVRDRRPGTRVRVRP